MKNRKKKVILSTVILCLSFAPICFAAGNDIADQGVIPVKADVTATTISATIPLSLSIAIDANQAYDNAFVCPDIKVINTTNAPITLSAVNMTAEAANTCKVVAKDKVGDAAAWQALSATDTKKMISFSIMDGSINTGWNTPNYHIGSKPFAAETEQTTFQIGDISALGTVNFQLNADHGMAWDEAIALNYNLTLKISLLT